MNTNVKTKNSVMSRECLVCGTTFLFHASRENTAKYCSPECHRIAQKGQKAWNEGLTKGDYIARRKVLVLTNKCLNCGKPVKNKFCNCSCQSKYQHKQKDSNWCHEDKTYVELYGEKRALEVRQKASKSISKTAAKTHFTRIGASVIGDQRRGNTWEEMYGVEKAAEMKQSIRDSLAAFRETPEGLKVLQEASDRGIRLALSGKEFVNTKKGYFEGIYFGSSLEEQFLQQVLRIIGSLKNVERNTTRIIPKDKGFRKTVPDYLIKDDDGREIALIEVKSNHLLERDDVYKKALALYNYSQEQDILAGYFTYSTLAVFKELQGNPEPRRLNSLLNYMVLELYDYVVSRKVQRLSVEDKETKKTLKNVTLGSDIPNDPLPYIGMEGDIARYPMKVGECI